jgi:oligopeptidase B
MHAFAKPSGRKAGPVAERRPVAKRHHGIELIDDYDWLRATNWQEVMRRPSKLDAAIRAHLKAENAHMQSALADTLPLQKQLFREMKARIKEDDSDVPSPDGLFEYYERYVEDGDHPLVMRRRRTTPTSTPGARWSSEGATEECILDGNAEAEGHDYWELDEYEHSPDHKLLAYAVDEKGSELYDIRIRDIVTGRDLDEIPDTRGEMVWAADSRTLFYVRMDENHRPLSVWRHVVGTPVTEDVLVYEEKDAGFYVGLGQTQSGDFLQIDVHDHQTSELYVIDAHRPLDPPRLLAGRRHGHEYDIEHNGDLFYVITNSAGAEDFRVCTVPVATPAEANWRELVPHKAGRLVLEITVYKEHMVRLEREEGLSRIVIRRLADGVEHAISFDEEAYTLDLEDGYEFETTTLRFAYSSMTTPEQIFDYDMETRERRLRKTQEVPSGHDPADYVTRRLHAPAPDGELVPISVLYRKGTPLDGSAPLFLYGYGAYGVSIPAAFSTNRLSLVDRGFVYAIAHIRGGKEKGYRWYTDGKAERKINTFTDYIAAAEHLAEVGFTSRGRIVAYGGSAGGMLMGVVANMAPELFLGIIADVPFVDVLNTMLDDTLPLTPPEWPEWGNPIESRTAFEMIRSYSPYDNVAAKRYPHIFAYGGLTDPRVTYWEPAKWVARLRERSTSDNMILLHINMKAGHGGASGRFESLKEHALDYAFAIKIAGLPLTPPPASRKKR